MAREQIPTEEDIIADAIAGTEAEIFEEATGQTGDDNDDDRSLEEMDDDDIPGDTEEGDEEPEEESPEGDEEQEEELEDSEQDDHPPEPERDERGRIPAGRQREEIQRRIAAEQERDAYRAQLAAFQAQLQMQQRPPPQEQANKPDLFSDPDAWAANQRAEIAREFSARHVNSSMADAHEEHGQEFEAAYRALTSLNPSDPSARAMVQRIYDAPNPGRAIMRWYGEQKLLQEVGSDPNAYRQKVAKEIMSDPEFRKQFISELRGEAQRGDNGRPRTTTRFPKSLNEASGGGTVRTSDPELYNNSEDSVFAYAMR